jgi:hypothetical protein
MCCMVRTDAQVWRVCKALLINVKVIHCARSSIQYELKSLNTIENNIVTCYLLTRRIIYVGCGFCVSIYWILHQATFTVTCNTSNYIT